ncbi:MAG TPA: diacylglycerol kinase family protein, partial [Gemmatimonadaceae bacterium]|nr:diacylglycerol kinase family protein [Gemmatimonadaceae bacterium]
MPELTAAARYPAFLNTSAGGTSAALVALERDERFSIVATAPEALAESIRAAADRGERRVLVAGGDGTLRTAASAVAGTPVEMAVLPAGTLNHFAKRHRIPTDVAPALDVAVGVHTETADVGYVNEHLFLNTSSVGAYVTFVRTRERLERRLGYWIASLVASLRILGEMRTFLVELEVEGARKMYRSPLVFVGIGERELKLPALGGPAPNGRRGLHVMIVRGRTRAKLVALAMAAAARGTRWLARTPHLDSFIVDRCRITMPRRLGRVAVDGEILLVAAPLEYTL